MEIRTSRHEESGGVDVVLLDRVMKGCKSVLTVRINVCASDQEGLDQIGVAPYRRDVQRLVPTISSGMDAIDRPVHKTGKIGGYDSIKRLL